MFARSHTPKSLLSVLIAGLLLGFSSCVSQDKPVVVLPPPPPPPLPEKTVEEPPMPEPFITDWLGTTWIIRESGSPRSRSYPGYQGFHLAADGLLLLVNMDMAVGNRWSAEGNNLHLSILDGIPNLSLEGSFQTWQYEGDEEKDDTVIRMLLVPEGRALSEGVIFEQASAKIDIVENHWKPKRVNGSENMKWPMNKELHMILLPDYQGGLGILGYGGTNRFKGEIILKNGEFTAHSLAISRRSGPHIAFENQYVQNITQSTRYVQVDKDLFLYEDARPLLGFRAQLFN